MKPLRIHYLQHVPFEGAGYIAEWAAEKGHSLSATKFYEGQVLPDPGGIDWLIIMGGPMGVYDEDSYPWLKSERSFIGKAIRSGKVVIGICLGAQLIADTLGAKVYPNPEKEIGWFPVSRLQTAPEPHLLKGIAPSFQAFHWHGDTFDLPANAVQLMKSRACEHQAFLYGRKVLGLQFHLEATPYTLREMVTHGAAELVPAKFIQPATRILANAGLTVRTNSILKQMLDQLVLAGNSKVSRVQTGS